MSITVYVPIDASALSLGAEAVANAIAAEATRRGAGVRIIRNGSRGMYWLEPLVEVETADGRYAYGPVQAEDVPSLFDADFLHAVQHGQQGAGRVFHSASDFEHDIPDIIRDVGHNGAIHCAFHGFTV